MHRFSPLRSVAAKVVTGAAVLAATTSAAFAAPIDVSATVTAIGDALTPIGDIGIAVLGVLVAVKVYKWVRRAM